MLPSDFLERFQRLCPDPLLEDALHSFQTSKQVAFRTNKLASNSTEVLNQLNALELYPEKVHWAHDANVDAFLCPPEQRETLTYSDCANSGDIYIQGLSSMLAAILLEPTPSDWLLDLAAAPGGKTILLAEMMNNEGKISAVEPVKSRFFRLSANLNRTGVKNTTTYMKDGRAVGSLKPSAFDRVLLDAPCSSESRFRTSDPSSTRHWNLKKVSECAKKQKRLILSGFDALKPGGRMVYCTCSYSPEENELVLAHLLKKRQNAELQPVNIDLQNATPGMLRWDGKALPEIIKHAVRIWPTNQMDGFFIAAISKHL